jgi:hypothetical protein
LVSDSSPARLQPGEDRSGYLCDGAQLEALKTRTVFECKPDQVEVASLDEIREVNFEILKNRADMLPGLARI